MPKTDESNLVKKPNIKLTYSPEQIEELVNCADPITGAEYFMSHFFYIQHPVRGRALYKPYDFQKNLLKTYNDYRLAIAMVSRQMGKTTTAAGFLLWYAMFHADSTVLVAAHKYTGAQEIMHRIRFAYENCPDYIRCGAASYNKGSLEFDNGSRILSQTTTETTGRGLSLSLMYLDEFAHLRSKQVGKALWASISPTLSTGGKLIITSTPDSDEDQFSDIWRQANKCRDEYGNTTDVGINGFKAFEAKWFEHPDRDEAWALNERNNLGEELFRREHLCEFIIDSETLINPLKLADLKGVEPSEIEGKIRWYEPLDERLTYLIALDPSLGTGGDPAAIQIFSMPNKKQVGEWTHNKTAIEKQVQLLAYITKKLDDFTKNNNQVYYTIENNTIGEAALVAIRNFGEENIAGILLSEPSKVGSTRKTRKGLNTSNSSKVAACAQLKSMIEHDQIKISSKALISELKTFIATDASFAAKLGERDDLVMATISIIRMMTILKNYLPNLNEEDLDEEQLPMPFFATFY